MAYNSSHPPHLSAQEMEGSARGLSSAGAISPSPTYHSLAHPQPQSMAYASPMIPHYQGQKQGYMQEPVYNPAMPDSKMKPPISQTADPWEASGERRHDGRVAGLSEKMFWIVIVLIAVIVIAASVGGAIGGTCSNQKHDSAGVSATITKTITAG